jgi:glycosyltransferase involved in cell wall biosynthesis
VAYDLGGVGDIIEDGREGFLAGDADRFVARIAQLCADRALRRRMAEAARLRAGRFSWDAVVTRHMEIYGLAQARRHRHRLPLRRVA